MSGGPGGYGRGGGKGFMRRDPRAGDVPPPGDSLSTGMDVMDEGPTVLPGAPEPEKEPPKWRATFPPHWEGEAPLVTLYDGDPSKSSEAHLTEAVKVVHNMLPHDREPLEKYKLNPGKIFEDVVGISNYEVTNIIRVQNKLRWAMGMALYGVYELEEYPILRVYHGCTEKSAQNICEFGFRAAPAERSLWGKGIYSSAFLWEALAYGRPHPLTGEQTVIVARLTTGPKAIGTANQDDAGRNSDDKEILTTTNPNETIFCAKYECQMVASYRVTFKYRADIPHTEVHDKFVKMWHPHIFHMFIKTKSQPATAPSGPNSLQESNGFKVGDAVVLNTPCYKQFAFAKHKQGKIVKIIVTQLGSPNQQNRFMIQLDDRTLDTQITAAYWPPISATRWGGQGGDTVIAALSVGIKKVDPASGAASRLAGFAASQMAAAGTSVQQAVVVTWEPTWKDKHTRKTPKPFVHFQVGDRVYISKNLGLGIFNRCFNKKGTIKAIFKGGDGGNVHFCIELDDYLEGIHIKMNCRKQAWKFPGQEDNTNSKFQGQGHDTATWLVVTSGFVEKLDVGGAAVGVAVGQKRKAD